MPARSSATPQRMSRSETSTIPRPNAVSTHPRITTPATIVGRPVGVQSGHLAALARAAVPRAGPAGSASVRARQHVALDPRGVVGIEREVDRGARRRGAGDGDRRARRSRGRRPARRPRCRAPHSAASASSSAGRRRVVGDGRSRVADDADLGRDVEARLAPGAADELGRAAADVDHHAAWWCRPPGAPRSRPRTCSAASSSPESVRRREPEALGHGRRNASPLAGVAHRGGHHRGRSPRSRASAICAA